MKRPTPPRHLTKAFHQAGLSWYLHGDQAPDNALRLHDGGPACWLAQFDEHERPCAGRLEVVHLIGRQRIRNILRPLLLTDLWAEGAIDSLDVDDLVALAEWDPRNAAPGCEGHHRRFDSHATPALAIPLDALPEPVLDFIADWGFESEAERRFPASQAGAAARFQQQPPLVGAGADNRGGPSVAVTDRSSLSAGSGESGSLAAGGGVRPADRNAAATPDSSGLEPSR